MTSFSDDLAGKVLEEKDVISYILAGLDAEFNPFIESICGLIDPIFLSTMYSRTMALEAQIASQKAAHSYITVNATLCGRCNGGRSGASPTDTVAVVLVDQAMVVTVTILAPDRRASYARSLATLLFIVSILAL